MPGKGRPRVHETEEERINARRADGRRAYYKNTGKTEESIREKIQKAAVRKQIHELKAPIRSALKTNDVEKLKQLVTFISFLESQ